jgi:hypothetical protein
MRFKKFNGERIGPREEKPVTMGTRFSPMTVSPGKLNEPKECCGEAM